MITYVEATCQCGLNVFNLAFSTAALPVPNIICHCNTCRHVSGQMARNYAPFQGAPLPAGAEETVELSTLATYKTSEHVTRWSCGNCSANVFTKHTILPDWYVAVSMLQKSDGIVSSKSHVWVSDTLDWGLADYLRAIDGHVLPRYSTWPKKGEMEGDILPLGWRTTKESTEAEHLRMYCHCKAITHFHHSPHRRISPPILSIPRPYVPLSLHPDDKTPEPGQ
ncbi:hypothetical protein FPV67DRAFT_1105332 [Lyophyllum atratum]|nr:hypothetical protein FPV67DRAFT_1105332 [Lyophyllum atratum]